MVRTSLLNDIIGLRDSVDDLFGETGTGDTFGTLASRAEASGGVVARPRPLDIYVTDDQVVVMAAVPGMNPGDLQLTVYQNTVTLSGSLRSTTDTEEIRNATWYINELPSGSFRRSITLSFQVDADEATASFERGSRRVVLPKVEAVKPKRIAISAGHQQVIGATNTD